MSKQYKTSNPEYCVDIPGAIRANVQAISYKCHGGPNQKFRYNNRTKQIRSVSTNKCLTASRGRVVQKRCDGKSKSQKWRKTGKKQWKNVRTRKCMDIEGGHYKNGNVIVWSCHDGPNQKFTEN
jgi:hypothetical protein